jgi:hypothetical protein
VIGFLRFIAVMNAAVWLGSSVFLAAGVAPAFMSTDMQAIIPRAHGEAAYHVVATHLYLVQAVCATIAIVVLFMEWLYSGKPVPRGVLAIVLAAGFLAALGGFGVQKKVRQLHFEQHHVKSTPAQRAIAAHSFGVWNRVSQGMQIAITLAVAIYLWRLVSPSNGTSRFSTTHKFRG